MSDSTPPNGHSETPTPTRLAWRLSYEPQSVRDAYDRLEQQ
jgi:hypothetical protein